MRSNQATSCKHSECLFFGSSMDGSMFSGDKCWFGFNGQEKDDEMAGTGNINTAMFWENDSRLRKYLNLDQKPSHSIVNALLDVLVCVYRRYLELISFSRFNNSIYGAIKFNNPL